MQNYPMEFSEDRVTLTVQESVTATFALRYLVTFAKAAPLSSVVELGLGPDSPLMVKYELENAENGHMQSLHQATLFLLGYPARDPRK